MRIKKFTFIILSICILFTFGSSSWAIMSNKELSPYYDAVSALTEYIDSEQNADEYIFEDPLNPVAADAGITYSSISSDKTYLSDARTIYLGYTEKNKNLEINTNINFMHKNSAFTYNSSDYNGTNFCFSDITTRTFTYYSSAANETNDKASTFKYSDKWTNYYHFDNTLTQYKNGAKIVTKLPGRLYTLKLVGDVIIKSGSTVSLGAEVGGSTQPQSGAIIGGNFVELDLNGHNLTIESGATLNAYGYVIDSKLDSNGKHKGCIYNYGNLYTPFVVENFMGGGYTVASGAYGTAPFSMFDMPYLSCKTYFYYGSTLNTPTGLSANDAFNKVIVKFVGTTGSGSLIELSENSFVIRDTYNPYTENTAAKFASKFKIYYDFNGDININTFSLNLKVVIEKKINMAEFGMSIPPYANITVSSGTITLGMRLDFMPGSTLYIAKNATVKFSSLSLAADETIALAVMTTYGGIRMLSQLTADSSSCYAYPSFMGTLAGYSSYLQYESSINVAGNTEARAIIDGNIIVNSAITSKSIIMVGKINLSTNALNYLNSNISKFQTFHSSNEYYAYISGTDLGTLALSTAFKPKASDIQKKATSQTCSSYHVLPLVSKGKVINPSSISSTFNNDSVTYDFTEGIYKFNNKIYAYIPSNTSARDASGSIVEVTHNSTTHTISYNSKNYVYYRNMFVSLPDIDNLYAYDNKYSGYSKNTYNQIDISSNKVKFTYEYKVEGRKDTCTFSRTRKRTSPFLSNKWGTWGAWSDYVSNNDVQTGTDITVNKGYEEGNVNIISYSFSYSTYNFGDIDTYKTYVYNSTLKKPILASKFSQSTDLNTFYRIGSLNLEYYIEAIDEPAEWQLNTSSPIVEDTYSNNDDTPGRLESNTHTQKETVTATMSTGQRIEEKWSVSGVQLGVMTANTFLKWSSTYGCWIKG